MGNIAKTRVDSFLRQHGNEFCFFFSYHADIYLGTTEGDRAYIITSENRQMARESAEKLNRKLFMYRFINRFLGGKNGF